VDEEILELLRTTVELRRNLNQHQRAEQVLLETKRRFQRLIASSPVVIHSSQPAGNYGITFISKSINQFGYEPQQFLEDASLWKACIHADDAAYVFAELAHLPEKGHRILEYRFLHCDGEYRWIQDQRNLIRDESGREVEIIGSWQDITERKGIEQALFQEKELAQNVLQSIGDGVITTDAIGYIQYLNPVAEQITGWNMHQAKGLALNRVFKLIDALTRQTVENLVKQVKMSARVAPLHSMSLVARDETEHAIEGSVAPICDRENQMIGTVMVFRDVTQHHYLARKLSWQASHDALTGLVNRQEFEHCLIEAITSARETEQEHVLCYLDLDQFKVVNDTCGHIAGDELLRQIAALLQKKVRVSDTLARLGGDEFGILLNQCSLESAQRIAEQVHNVIHDFRFIWQNNTFSIGACLGMVAINADSGDLSTILSAADAACYAAKDKGRNRIHVYQVDDHELAQQRGERQWISRLTKALEENRLCLYGQAIVPIAHPLRTATHYELLLRLISETGEIVPPMAFIPAAERYGLMPTLDRWVISTFFANYSGYTYEHFRRGQPCLYTINLSGASINDETLLVFLKDQFNRHQVSPRTICFEITETTAIANLAKAAQLIRELKQIGCHFALDDFGSGMSSFSYLKNLPIDYLKIDGSFIKNIVTNAIDSVMVECINRIGHMLGLLTIAEFVENEAILNKLHDLGVDYAQGYGIAEPCPMEHDRGAKME
jgi:diguanylate cyclase (GGDEF)-like protein/PAS domain S-box-containing protein